MPGVPQADVDAGLLAERLGKGFVKSGLSRPRAATGSRREESGTARIPADAPEGPAPGSARSTTVTRSPAHASSYAHAAPIAPAPTTTASGRFLA